jgi:hypothetical protein
VVVLAHLGKDLLVVIHLAQVVTMARAVAVVLERLVSLLLQLRVAVMAA